MRNVVQLCLAEKNILHKTTLFSFLRSLFSVKMADCFASFRTFIKNQTWWSNDKTIIDWTMVITKYRDLSMSPRSRYFPQPRPIIVKNWVFIELAIEINHINIADVVVSALLSPGKTYLWNCRRRNHGTCRNDCFYYNCLWLTWSNKMLQLIKALIDRSQFLSVL